MVRFVRVVAAATLVFIVGASSPAPAGAQLTLLSKLDPLAQQVTHLTGRSQIIVRGTSAQALQSVLPLMQLLGGRILRQLPHLNSAAVDMPNAMLLPIAASSLV